MSYRSKLDAVELKRSRVVTGILEDSSSAQISMKTRAGGSKPTGIARACVWWQESGRIAAVGCLLDA